MEVARPISNPPCTLYKPHKYTHSLKNVVRLPLSTNKGGAGKSHAGSSWFHRSPFNRHFATADVVASPQQKVLSTTPADSCNRRGEMVDVATKSDKIRVTLLEKSIRKTAGKRLDSETPVTHTLLSKFEGFQKERPLCLRKKGMHTEICRLIYPERPRDTVRVDAHCKTRDAPSSFPSSGIPFPVLPNAMEASTSPDGAVRAFPTNCGRVVTQVKSESFNSLSRPDTWTEGPGDTAPAGGHIRGDPRPGEIFHSNKEGSFSAWQPHLQNSPCSGLNDGSLPLSRTCDGQWRRSVGDPLPFPCAFRENSFVPVSATLKAEVGADIPQLWSSREHFLETTIRPSGSREETGRTHGSDLCPYACAQSAEKCTTRGTADATAADHVERAHCVQSSSETPGSSCECQPGPVSSPKIGLFPVSGDAFYEVHARIPMKVETLVKGETTCSARFFRRDVKCYTTGEAEDGSTCGSARSTLQALKGVAAATTGSVVARCTRQRSSSQSPAVNQERLIRLLHNNAPVLRAPSVTASPAGESPAALCLKTRAGRDTTVGPDKRVEKSSALCTSSSLSRDSMASETNRQKRRNIPVWNNGFSEGAFPPRRMLLPIEVTHLHTFLLAWKRIATERTLLRDLYLAARRQTEGRLLRRSMLGLRQHKERRAQLHLKNDICALHTLEHSASRHFTAWIRIFCAASARNAFLKSFAFRGFQQYTHHKQQQSTNAVAAHERRLKVQAVKSMQEYVKRRHQERATLHLAAKHHEHSMLKKALYAWSRWHAYMNACIKLLRVASQLEDQQNKRILPIIFNAWRAEMKQSRAETTRALAQAAHLRVGLAFKAWRRRSAATNILILRRKEYNLHLQRKALRQWKTAYCAQWKQHEAVQRKVRQITKRRGVVFLRAALTTWLRYTRRRAELARASRSIEKKRKQLVLQNCKIAAFLSSVSRCLSRNAAVRSACKALSTWRAYARQQKRERFINFFFLKQREKHAVVSTWTAWRHLQASVHASRKYFKKHVLQKVYCAWRNFRKKRNSLRDAMDSWERQVRLTNQARVFELWKSRSCSIHSLKTQVFSAWHCVVRKCRHARMATQKIWQIRAHRFLSGSWLTWKTLLRRQRQVEVFSQKIVARKIFRALLSYAQSRKWEQVKAARLKFRFERTICYRTFSTWLQKVQVRRTARVAYETVTRDRKDYLLASTFYNWTRAAGLRFPAPSTVKCLSDLFDTAPQKEWCSPPVQKSHCALHMKGMTARRSESSGWGQECLPVKHRGRNPERSVRNGVGMKLGAHLSAEHLNHARALVDKTCASRKELANAERIKDIVQVPARKSKRMSRLIQEKLALGLNMDASSHFDCISSDATTASDSPQLLGPSDVEVRLSRGRQQVYVDYFWDTRLLNILSAWRRIAQRRERSSHQRDTGDTSARRFVRSPADSDSTVHRSAGRNSNAFSETEVEASANPVTPRFAYEFVNDVSCNYLSAKVNAQAQHRPRCKLRQVLVFKRLSAKRQAFKNWLAFCTAKNAIVSRLEDEFRGVRCLRRWKLELSRRQSLQALAHVHTHYLTDLEST